MAAKNDGLCRTLEPQGSFLKKTSILNADEVQIREVVRSTH